ncbi:hypothetical protein PHISCL_10006 [Aspergillus sclerotialis]|uniref:Uncharacterized protein n=1 Tax=Aspergillus sclerotialis TaxID=2070753 RepID=A0A3A2Z460_9EURO|nr:hypothetical protein PHISCL_10006 [Aspergillus sclerotialis]
MEDRARKKYGSTTISLTVKIGNKLLGPPHHPRDTGTSLSNDSADQISTACSAQTSGTTSDLDLIDPRLFEPGPLLDKSVPLTTEVCSPADNPSSSAPSAKDTQYDDIAVIHSWGHSSTTGICDREGDHMSSTIWRKPEPKPAVKRKRGTGPHRKRVGANEEGAAPKKIKFRHYQPLPHRQPVAVEPHSPTAVNLPTHNTVQAGFVNQQHAEFDHNARVHTRVSLDSESSMGEISTATSLRSSTRTTPDLDLIDPGFLSQESREKMVTPDDRPSPSNDDEDTGQDGKTVAQSCEHMSSLYISGNTCDHEDARVVEPPASPGRAKPHADLSWVDCGSLEDSVPRGNTPTARRAPTPFSSTPLVNSALSSTPKTRGRTTPRYSSKSPNTGYISKYNSLLAPRERSAL